MSLMRKIKFNLTKGDLLAYITKTLFMTYFGGTYPKKSNLIQKKPSQSVNIQDSKTCAQGNTNCLEMDVFMWEQVNSKILLTRLFKVTSNKNVTFLVPPLSQQCLLHILDLLQGDLNVHAYCLKTSLFFIHERSFIHIWFYPPSICPYLDFTCLADTNV